MQIDENEEFIKNSDKEKRFIIAHLNEKNKGYFRSK